MTGSAKQSKAGAQLDCFVANAPRNDVRGQTLGAVQFAITNPAVDDSAVTVAPQVTSTAATGQVQCLSNASDVRSNVA